MSMHRTPRRRVLRTAAFETLEGRRLLSATAVTGGKRLVFADPAGGADSRVQNVRLFNRGDQTLTVASGGLTFTGNSPSMFGLAANPGALSIAPGDNVDLQIEFKPPSGTEIGSIRTAKLVISSNDPVTPQLGVNLRGLVTSGFGGASEPSLDRILQALEITTDVGDSTPNTVDLDRVGDSDAILATQFVKAGSGPVQFAPAASYGVAGTNLTASVGVYNPGDTQSRRELFRLSKADYQTLAPNPNGAVRYDNGAAPFSFYAEFPTFRNADTVNPRVVYGEPTFNSWEDEADDRLKTQVFPYYDANGLVADTYIVAFEEFEQGLGDFQDVVLIVKNVKPVKSNPNLGLRNDSGFGDPTRLVFSQVGIEDPDFGNEVADTASLRLVNSGTKPLTFGATDITGPFTVTSGPANGSTLAAGAATSVNVRFTATAGDVRTGSLTLRSNDPLEPARVVELRGFWQSYSEEAPNNGGSQEPTTDEVMELLGYKTAPRHNGQSLNTEGRFQVVGDEILSPYWRVSDPQVPVRVQHLTAFHEQGLDAIFMTYPRNAVTSPTVRFTSSGLYGQSFLPRNDNNTSQPAGATFYITDGNAFGFRVDSERSDPTLNTQEQPGGGYGHHMRFYPLRDKAGSYVPEAYLMFMDYSAINYDFNDNTYLITGIRPADVPGSVSGLSGVATTRGQVIDWASRGDTARYEVYRSDRLTGKYRRISGDTPISALDFIDRDATTSRTWYYRVLPYDADGNVGTPADATVRAL